MTSKMLVSILVNLLDELEQIMGRYDFLEATRVIFRNVRTDSQLDIILINFSYEFRQIITRYDFLEL